MVYISNQPKTTKRAQTISDNCNNNNSNNNDNNIVIMSVKLKTTLSLKQTHTDVDMSRRNRYTQIIQQLNKTWECVTGYFIHFVYSHCFKQFTILFYAVGAHMKTRLCIYLCILFSTSGYC